jgi:hypothetical protein
MGLDRGNSADGGKRQDAGFSTPAPRLHEALAILRDKAQVEIEAVKQSVAYILETTLGELVALQDIDCCADVWPSFRAEATTILRDIRRAIGTVSEFAVDSENLSYRALLELHTATPEIAGQVLTLTHKTLSLAKEIVHAAFAQFEDVRSVDDDGSERALHYKRDLLEKLDLVGNECQAMLQLFVASGSRGQDLTVLDLIAGCAFRRSVVCLPAEAGASLGSATLAIPPESAAAAVLMSMTALDKVRHSLFGRCLHAVARSASDLPTLVEARSVFEDLRSPDDSPLLSGLCAIANHRSPICCSMNHEGHVVVSLVLPPEAQVFEYQSIVELADSLAVNSSALEAVAIPYSCAAYPSERGFEVAVVLQIPCQSREAAPLESSQLVFEQHSDYEAAASSVSSSDAVHFQCLNDARTVQVRLVRSLFAPLPGGDEEPHTSPNQLDYAVDALRMGQIFDHGGYVGVAGEPILVAHDKQQFIAPGYVVSIGRAGRSHMAGTANTGLQEMDRYVARWLQDPNLNNDIIPDHHFSLAFSAPSQFAHNEQFCEELAKLSEIVAVDQLMVPWLRDSAGRGSPERGAKLLKDLRELLQSDEEHLAQRERPRMMAFLKQANSDSAMLHFYLTSSELGLRGVGSIPIARATEADIPTLTTFSSNVALKSSQLIAAITASMDELSGEQGPPESRLVNKLLKRGFALSLSIASAIVVRKERSLGKLSSSAITEIVFSEIALHSENLQISEHFSFTDRAPFTLSILTKREARAWLT